MKANRNSSGISLEVNNISKAYKTKKENIIAVNNINFSINGGEIVGLLGNNGAGKTTLIKIISKLILPDKGTVKINGFDIKDSSNKYNTAFSVVFDGSRSLYWRMTLIENINWFCVLKGINPATISDRIDYYINFFNLNEKRNTITGKLSRGMQQKASLAIALISNADVIILDEPTLGLDVNSLIELKSLLKNIAEKENKIIFMSSHDMAVVQEICTRTILIKDGNLIKDCLTVDLLNLFSKRAFEISTDLNDAELSLLADKEEIDILRSDTGAQIRFESNDLNLLFKILKLIDSTNSKLHSINTNNYNLEDIFVKLIRG